MRALVQVNKPSLRVIFCVVAAAIGGACTPLKPVSPLTPPTQATAEQAAERDRESPTPKVMQTRPSGNNPQQCLVNFDDEGALGQIYAQARSTLAFKTTRAPNGQLQICDPSKHGDCWTYRQRCSRGDVNLDTIGTTHYHLSMETGIECYTLPDAGDGLGRGFGRLVEWKCTDVDWGRTPRVLSSHDQSQWVKVWVSTTDTHIPMYFDMDSIQILSDTSIQLWFRKRDGTWWFWSDLKAGHTWNVRDQVRDVSEVRIRGAKVGRASSYVLGAVTIKE